jgi:hypothetical protein
LLSDKWIFIWGNSKFTSGKLYNLAFSHIQVPSTFKRMWWSKCIPRLKFFAWLLLVDRLNTKAMLTRRNNSVDSNDHCVLRSSQADEDIGHLFFSCPFPLSCWQKIGVC